MGSSRPQQIHIPEIEKLFFILLTASPRRRKGSVHPHPSISFFCFFGVNQRNLFGVNQRNRHDRGVRPHKSNTYIPDIEKLFLIFAGFALSTNNTGQQTPSCLVRHAAAVAAVDERLGT